jgi:tripartite-type tricarboxylate transporter receptor subunit TctC
VRIALLCSVIQLGCGDAPATRAATGVSEWPTGTVTLITHSSPGGGGDIMARELGRTLERLYDVNVVVENRVGGSGAVSLVYMANRVPTDGSVLQVITPTHLITPIRSRGVPTYQQMTPIARLLLDPTVVYVRRESPFRDMAALIAFARDNPGALKWGIGSAGSLDHLVVQEIEAKAGFTVTSVPHEGGGDAMLSVLGGHIDAGIGEPIKILAQVQAGNLRILAVFDEQRLDEFPDVQAVGELGYQMTSQKFRGVWGPPGMSDVTVRAIADALERVLTEEPFQKYWHDGAMQSAFLRESEFAAFLSESDASIRQFLTLE